MGGGAVFRFVLPARPPPAMDAEVEALPVTQGVVSEPTATLVVIEDDPQIRRFLRTGLSAQPFRIFEAETGHDGLVEAATRKPDLVILDLGLPDIDGVDVVTRLREWYTRPIVILSARSDEQEKIKALDAGADDYLTKPFGIGELLARTSCCAAPFVAR